MNKRQQLIKKHDTAALFLLRNRLPVLGIKPDFLKSSVGTFGNIYFLQILRKKYDNEPGKTVDTPSRKNTFSLLLVFVFGMNSNIAINNDFTDTNKTNIIILQQHQ